MSGAIPLVPCCAQVLSGRCLSSPWCRAWRVSSTAQSSYDRGYSGGDMPRGCGPGPPPPVHGASPACPRHPWQSFAISLRRGHRHPELSPFCTPENVTLQPLHRAPAPHAHAGPCGGCSALCCPTPAPGVPPGAKPCRSQASTAHSGLSPCPPRLYRSGTGPGSRPARLGTRVRFQRRMFRR